MAGLRPKEANSDDAEVTINNDNYKDSNYTGSEAKQTVKDNTTQNTQQIMQSTPTTQTTEFITSNVTGVASGGDADSDELKNIKDSQDDAQKEQLQSVAQINPDYLMEQLDYTPDEISEFVTVGQDFSYQELEEGEVGEIFIDISKTTNQSVSQNAGYIPPGQEINNKYPDLVVTTEFCHPMGTKGSKTTSKFGLRAIHYKKKDKNGNYYTDPNFRWRTHSGLDLVPSNGSKNPPVYAIYDGRIYIGNSPNGKKGYSDNNSTTYGNYVFLYFTYKAKDFLAVYAHLNTVILGTSINPNGFYIIKKGQAIGTMGGTGGPAGTFPEHLHFEIQDMSGSKWTKLRVNMKTDTYNGEYCNDWDGTSAVPESQGSNWIVSVSPRYDSYIDPADFFKNPNKYLARPTTFSHYS